MLNLYAVVLILVYPIFLEEYYGDSLSNNSCFTKAASNININHWWYIKGQLIDMVSIGLRNWTGDRTKSASFDYQLRDKKRIWHYCISLFFATPLPIRAQKFGLAYMYYNTNRNNVYHCPIENGVNFGSLLKLVKERSQFQRFHRATWSDTNLWNMLPASAVRDLTHALK